MASQAKPSQAKQYNLLPIKWLHYIIIIITTEATKTTTRVAPPSNWIEWQTRQLLLFLVLLLLLLFLLASEKPSKLLCLGCVCVCVCCGAYVSIQLPTHIGCQSNRINSKQHCAPHQSLTGLLSKRRKEEVEEEGATLVVFIRRWANKILYYFIMWKLLILIWYHNLLEPSNLAPASFLYHSPPPLLRCGILINWISIH